MVSSVAADDELHAARLIEETLEDQGALGRQRPERAAAGGKVTHQLHRGGRGHAGGADHPGGR
jgi:hypothetical protein